MSMKHQDVETVIDHCAANLNEKGKMKSSPCSSPNVSRESSKANVNISKIKQEAPQIKGASSINRPTSVTSRWTEYKPIPYVFRTSPDSVSFDNEHSIAKSPPFFIQLDHLLAVIWTIFSKRKAEKPLGVAQLHWALNFLKCIRNKQGKHTKDIAVCIEAIEETLIQQYAAMAEAVKSLDSIPKQIALINLKRPTSMINNFSINYSEMSEYNTDKLTINGIPSPSNESIKMESSKLRQTTNLKGTISSAPFETNLGETKHSSNSIDDNDNKNYSQKNVLEVLKGWRKQQINKLQEELQRLHSIETFIGNIEKGDFKPYLDPRQLDILIAHNNKMKRNHISNQPFCCIE